jgi:gamma-glutamyltranspeptidase/glutathione hydrolase
VEGIVVCPETPAVEAGRRIFAMGGNAIDAAVATALAQGVTNPLGCGIGGLAFIQVYSASHDVCLYLNASVAIGSASDGGRFLPGLSGRSERVGRYLVEGDPNQMGYASIMSPGFIAGLGELAARFGSGRVTWQDMVEPAAALAADGFQIYPYLKTYYTFEGPDRPGYPDIFRKLSTDAQAAALYMPRGQVPQVGDRLQQRELGATLRRIARGGPEEFYRGGVAGEIVADFVAHDAPVTAADLASYTVRTEMPIVVRWRDLEFQASPPPSHGAILLAMLRAVEDLDFARFDFNSPVYIDVLARVTNRAFADGIGVLADPAFAVVPVEQLISRSRARAVTASLARAEAGIYGGGEGHTTHVTAADSDHNVVAITHSIGSITGAGVMTPALGFLYNNFLGHFNPRPGYRDSIVAGKRVGGGCPTIVFRNGRPIFAIGSSGGSRLISAVFQTILNVFVHRMDPQSAVGAPRFHCEQDGRLYLEPTFPPATVEALRRRGYEIIPAHYMGCNQAVHMADGGLAGGSDPRGGIGIAMHRP